MSDRSEIAAGVLIGLLGLVVTGFIIARIFGVIGFLSVPSSSMEPSLPINSHFVASSLPYWRDNPRRGDIVTFYSPRDGRLYVKRLIGLPGDSVQMRDGQVVLNGKAVPRRPAGSYQYHHIPDYGLGPTTARQYEETLPSGVSYRVLDLRDTRLDNTKVFKVPVGHYFMLGDNRDNSSDSRISLHMGVIPRKNITGRYFARNPVTEILTYIEKEMLFGS